MIIWSMSVLKCSSHWAMESVFPEFKHDQVMMASIKYNINQHNWHDVTFESAQGKISVLYYACWNIFS